MALGQLTEAKQAYETCLELDGNFVGVHLQLAEIYEKKKIVLRTKSYGSGNERRAAAY